MNVVLDPQPNCIVNLEVELPPDRVSRAWDTVARDFQRHARVPGYRPGKAPQSLIDSRFAKDIREELQNKLLRESLNDAIKQKNLNVLRVAEVADVRIGDDRTMRFRASVVTAPEFELPDYSAITVEAARRAVTDDDVDKWVEQMREPHASFDPVEGRPLAAGDYAVMTYEATCEGKPLNEVVPSVPPQLQGRRNAWVFIDPGTLIPGFAEAVSGMTVDESRSFDLNVPDQFPLADLRGKTVSYAVTLHGINSKTLPPVDDELAAKIEPGKTLAELRAGIRERLDHIADSQFEAAKRNGAMKHLLAAVTCELPAHAVEREVASILRDIVRENQGRGVSDEELRKHQEELIGVAEQSARDRVRGNFLLLRIAEKEKLAVNETDMISAVSELSRQYDIPVKKLIKDLQTRDGFGPLREQILMGKALDLIASNVTVRQPAEQPPAA